MVACCAGRDPRYRVIGPMHFDRAFVLNLPLERISTVSSIG
jgi:hypothetical protein